MEGLENETSKKKLSSSELRKIKKPLIEKRRRERINESLTQLKSLILEALNKDESQYNKMEKADILELTVKHLKNMHQQHDSLSPRHISASPVLNKPILQAVQVQPMIPETDNYKAGFTHCATEVNRFMQSIPAVKSNVKSHISNILNERIHSIPSKKSDCVSGSNTIHNFGGSNINLQSNNAGTTAYLQILSNEPGAGQKECMGSPIIQGLQCVQSLPVFNGQTIFLTNATVPTTASQQQLQHVLHLSQQPMVTNLNVQQQQQEQRSNINKPSPNYKENIKTSLKSLTLENENIASNNLHQLSSQSDQPEKYIKSDNENVNNHINRTTYREQHLNYSNYNTPQLSNSLSHISKRTEQEQISPTACHNNNYNNNAILHKPQLGHLEHHGGAKEGDVLSANSWMNQIRNQINMQQQANDSMWRPW